MKRFAPFTLASFEHAHTRAVIDIIEGCYAEYGEKIELESLDGDLLSISDLYEQPGCAFWVLLDEDRVIGSCAVKRVTETECELKRVFLNREYRGRGLGKRMSQFCFEWAQQHGYARVHIWSDALYETAHGLYKKLGAVETGERRHLGGVNDCWEKYFLLELGE